ncbi:MAG TPA: cyclic nucleotide-binding domain-containing protein, partial [Acidimicrobiales bacterium]|nr:cyclic nucleotide-binding domain-containing protein [Acidimicrobiales bacterium]
FAGCSTKELREIGRLGAEVRVPSGKVVTDEGAAGRELLIVISGRATCRVRGRKVATYGPGDFFGEMSLLDHGPRSATVTADTDLELLVLDGREFRQLVDASPGIAWKLLVAMAERLRQANRSLSN